MGGGVFVKKVENGVCFFRKKWTFPQRRVHYVQYQYFTLHFTYLGGAYTPNAPPPAYGSETCLTASFPGQPGYAGTR